VFGVIVKFINTTGKKGAIPLWFLAAIIHGSVKAALTSSNMLKVVLSHRWFMVLLPLFFINKTGRSIDYA
jgi:hypothetical protein